MKEYIRDACVSLALASAVFVSLIALPALAGTLSCSITTAAACTGGTNVIVLRMSAATNAHSELPSQSTASYASNVMCCSGVTGLGNLCSGTFATVLKLQAVTNSHVQQNSQTGYANSACLSVSSGSVSVGYQATNCTGFDTTVGSTSAVTNAHVGNGAAYAANQICATASAVSLTFTVTNQGFANAATNVLPGVALMATTTLSVTTSNTSGWNVTLSGDNKSSTNNNLQRTGDTTVQVTDQTEWIPGAATSTAGNAVRISSFTNSGNVLAFRVMTASSTNGTFFYAPTWWGSADNYVADNANTLYAGIASSTVSRQIGNAGTGSLSASAHLNDVQYYLATSLSQKTGSYTATVTYTATANP